MSKKLSRRTVIGLASAALLAATGGGARAGQSPGLWPLAAAIVFEPESLALQVTFSVDTSGSEPLYLQIADADDASIFFTWERIQVSMGDILFDIGPFDIPAGRAYLVSVVTRDGETDPRSPVVPIYVPALADRVQE